MSNSKKALALAQQRLNDPHLILGENIQSLWSGYGEIVRLYSTRSHSRYIAKIIVLDKAMSHPRGWNTDLSHQRKIRSYQVEQAFYQHYAQLTDRHCKVPRLVASERFDNGTLLLLEDLDACGYSQRLTQANWTQLKLTIRWLAYFHARFLEQPLVELWPTGTYWHWQTRQDEWHKMPEGELKQQAKQIDHKLSQAQYQTLLHGDAKLANFCYRDDFSATAAVDFQYAGAGSGVKDLAYLVGSGFTQAELTNYQDLIVDEYIGQLKRALMKYGKVIDLHALETEIRYLYPFAWADFYRFLLGWNPKSWKINQQMQDFTAKALAQL